VIYKPKTFHVAASVGICCHGAAFAPSRLCGKFCNAVYRRVTAESRGVFNVFDAVIPKTVRDASINIQNFNFKIESPPKSQKAGTIINSKIFVVINKLSLIT